MTYTHIHLEIGITLVVFWALKIGIILYYFFIKKIGEKMKEKICISIDEENLEALDIMELNRSDFINELVSFNVNGMKKSLKIIQDQKLQIAQLTKLTEVYKKELHKQAEKEANDILKK